MTITQLQSQIFSSAIPFEDKCLHVFRYQYEHNRIYHNYCDLIHAHPDTVQTFTDIPFLPIQFFKTHRVLSDESDRSDLAYFESSGTTGLTPSRHWRADDALYTTSFRACFQHAFGDVRRYCILGLLPSYLERAHSSLVFMVQQLIQDSGHPFSGFYLHNQNELRDKLLDLEKSKQPTLLFGVTYALLDFAEAFPLSLQQTTIIETGGMKGRREELNREEVHRRLKKAFQVDQIASEYGMTELFSQAYALVEGRFECPPLMKVLLRDVHDPLETILTGRGAIQVVDLANLHSCSFLATEDTGLVYPDGCFEILGRLDHSEWRGCSMLTL